MLPPGSAPDPGAGSAPSNGPRSSPRRRASIGVAPVVSTTYAEPFHVSSAAGLARPVSAGRAGWVVSGRAPTRRRPRLGRPPVDGGRRREHARPATRGSVRALWDSWEDDAVIRDVATSRYLDRDRLHYVDFTGEATPSGARPSCRARRRGSWWSSAAPELVGPPGSSTSRWSPAATSPPSPRRRRAGAPRSPRSRSPSTPRATARRPGRRPGAMRRGPTRPAAVRRRRRRLVPLLRELAGASTACVCIRSCSTRTSPCCPARPAGSRRAAIVTRPLPGTTLRATLGLLDPPTAAHRPPNPEETR